MPSRAEIAANERNSQHATGPTSKAGKARPRLNARNHGILARELLITDAERPEFEALQEDILGQLTPLTSLQKITAERIVCDVWRIKRATGFS